MIHLLRQLCNNDEVTTLTWDTAAAQLQQENIPNQFETRTKVVLMVNDWGAFKSSLESLEDRGVILSFEPSAQVVHEQVAVERWFDDQEIFQFIGDHLRLITRPTMTITSRHGSTSWRAWIGRITY